MLRRSAVIIMDEATSSIDLETDDQIQRTIRDEMSDALVITIAHRLKTVIDYDRVLVLDHGELVEFDSPATLMGQEGSVFRSMCQRSADWDELSRIASDHQTRR
ncbi:hypothetical protein FRC09_018309 [Ceratobasidium sp. 395]|nr:hypothetical protein FRC09_018309 [Ceratobasidium sp. 395]